MEYNTSLSKLIIPEYGRNVQKMVHSIIDIEDREKRNHQAKSIIEVMGNLNPHLRDVPDFKSGDAVRVNVFVTEGNKERVQAFEGICIARSNRGFNSTFTLRKVSHGEGVERVFPLYSPMLESIKLIRRGKVKRSKLYYLRQRSGKSARIAEKKDFIKKKPQASKVVDAPASSEEVKEESK